MKTSLCETCQIACVFYPSVTDSNQVYLLKLTNRKQAVFIGISVLEIIFPSLHWSLVHPHDTCTCTFEYTHCYMKWMNSLVHTGEIPKAVPSTEWWGELLLRESTVFSCYWDLSMKVPNSNSPYQWGPVRGRDYIWDFSIVWVHKESRARLTCLYSTVTTLWEENSVIKSFGEECRQNWWGPDVVFNTVHVGWMGNGDELGSTFTHSSLEGMNKGWMDEMGILFIPHSSPLIPIHRA